MDPHNLGIKRLTNNLWQKSFKNIIIIIIIITGIIKAEEDIGLSVGSFDVEDATTLSWSSAAVSDY